MKIIPAFAPYCSTEGLVRRALLWKKLLKKLQRPPPKMQSKLVLVTSYARLRRDINFITTKIQSMHGVILDEAHIIRNADTSTAKACYELGRRSAFRIALSGTPIHNDISDIWSIFRFILPGYLGSAANFKKTFGSLSRSVGQEDAMNILLFGNDLTWSWSEWKTTTPWMFKRRLRRGKS